MTAPAGMKPSSGWRRIAVRLCRHAEAALPAESPWARAMQRELAYIDDDRAALGWALGCVAASCRAALAARATDGLARLLRRCRERNPAMLLRHATASGVLMLVVGLAFLENAGGQTPPHPRVAAPAPGETACDRGDKEPGSGPDADDRSFPAFSRRAWNWRPVPAAQAPDAQPPNAPCDGRPAQGFPGEGIPDARRVTPADEIP